MTGGNSLRAYRFERRVLAESKNSAESSETAFPDIESEILLECRRTSFFSHLRIWRSGIVNVSEGNQGLTLTTYFSRYSSTIGASTFNSGVCDHTNRPLCHRGCMGLDVHFIQFIGKTPPKSIAVEFDIGLTIEHDPKSLAFEHSHV